MLEMMINWMMLNMTMLLACTFHYILCCGFSCLPRSLCFTRDLAELIGVNGLNLFQLEKPKSQYDYKLIMPQTSKSYLPYLISTPGYPHCSVALTKLRLHLSILWIAVCYSISCNFIVYWFVSFFVKKKTVTLVHLLYTVWCFLRVFFLATAHLIQLQKHLTIS